jgi:hypothetical protein
MTKKDYIKQMRAAYAPLQGMVKLVPADKLDWAPGPGFMTCGQLLKHLSESWFLEVFVTGDWPSTGEQEMTEAMKLENLPSSSKEEALKATENDFQQAVGYVENEIREEDFSNKTVTAPWGFEGTLSDAYFLTRDHFLNHKMQLFLYLKLLGVPVNTATLYGG